MRAIPPAGCGVERHACSRKYSVTLPTSPLAEPLLLVAVDWNDSSSSSASWSSVSLSSASGSSFGPRGGASIGRTASECSPAMKSSGSMRPGSVSSGCVRGALFGCGLANQLLARRRELRAALFGTSRDE